MDDELFKLEAELKRLRPAVPSRERLRRLDAELTPAPAARRAVGVSRGWAWWVWVGALPVAAALAVAFVVSPRPPPIATNPGPVAADAPVSATATEAMFKPVAAENVLYAASDEGPVTLDDGTSARRERLSYIDTINGKNSRTNASVRWTVPREEIRVVPVKFQ